MRRGRLILAGLLLAPAAALAEAGAMDAAQNLSRVALGLLGVMILIFGLAWAARRFPILSGLKADPNSPIRAVAQLSVGPKERIMLIEVDGRRLLIGVAPGLITLLDSPDGLQAGAGTDFASQLQASREARKK